MALSEKVRLGSPLEAISPSGKPLSLRFEGREVLAGLLARQGRREDGSKGEIESAYLDLYGKGDPRYGVIGAYWRDELLGASSFGVIENPHFKAHSTDPTGRRRFYGRIDTAVVPPEHRGYGVGRWLIEATLLYMLEAWPGEIYSLSTVAAHKAIVFILTTLGGFKVESKEGSVEEKISSQIDGGRERELLGVLKGKIEQSASRVGYKIRQGGKL